MAGCGGCQQRAQAIRDGAIAIADGRLDDAKAAAQRFGEATRNDIGKAATVARRAASSLARLGARR